MRVFWVGVEGAPGVGFLLPNLLSTGPASLLLLFGLPKVFETLGSSLLLAFLDKKNDSRLCHIKEHETNFCFYNLIGNYQ